MSINSGSELDGCSTVVVYRTHRVDGWNITWLSL